VIWVALLGALWVPSADSIAEVVSDRASRLGTPARSYDAAEVASAVLRAQRAWQLPPALLLAVAERESSFDFSTVSSAQCVGMMQVHPQTAREFAPAAGLRHYRLRRGADSVQLGAAYLSYLFTRYGRWDYALTAYNCGPGCFEAHYRVSAYARQVLAKQRRIGQALREES
jgi:soluble lytic murein transglycosylase-like protein